MASGAISVYQNASQTLSLHFTDVNGANVNLTGKTVYLYVAQGIDADNLITKTQADHTAPTDGQTAITLDPSDLDLPARSYRYEIWLDDAPSDTGAFVVKDTLRG